MAAAQPNHRASLLAGLRTGGVRSVSVPHTAAPAGSFSVPRVPSNPYAHHNSIFPEEDEMDHLADLVSQNIGIRDLANKRQSRTATLDHSGSRLSQQQQEILMQRQMHSQMQAAPMSPAMAPSADFQAQAQVQMQIMQMELMRLQALAQMQQFAQMQVENGDGHAQQPRRGSGMFEPSTAGPRTQTFATNGTSHLANLRARQMEQNQGNDFGSVPMTAALGGRFGSRPQADNGGAYNNTNRNNSSNAPSSATVGPSKSDAAVSWRRGSAAAPSSGADTVRSALRASAKVTPPSSDSERDPSPAPIGKVRPEPLHLAKGFSVPALPVGSNDDSELGDNDSSSSKSDTDNSSSPTTPMSSNSHTSSSSTREEASKKLFQGLGLGRPSIHVTAPGETKVVLPQRIISQPIRQPRGPPGAVDELGDKNFANRIRKKAIGGLGALLEARGKRDGVLEVECV